MSKRSISRRQRQANIENAKLSTGPRTPEGKTISSQNARKFKDVSLERLIDGMIVLGECHGGLELLLEQHSHDFLPQNASEFGIVEEMVKVKWEMERLQIARTNVINKLAAAAPEASPSLKLTAALESAYADRAFLNLERSIQRFRRDYSNLIATLGKARKLRQDHGTKTTPFSGQPDALDSLEAPVVKFAESNPTNGILNVSPAPQPAPTAFSKPLCQVSHNAGLIPTPPHTKLDASGQHSGTHLPQAA